MSHETTAATRAQDFEAGEHVRWVPEHAKGNASHPDCENGVVTSTNDKWVFVRFTGSTSQACHPSQLV